MRRVHVEITLTDSGMCASDFAPLPDRASSICLALSFALIGRDEGRGTKQKTTRTSRIRHCSCAPRVIYPIRIRSCVCRVLWDARAYTNVAICWRAPIAGTAAPIAVSGLWHSAGRWAEACGRFRAARVHRRADETDASDRTGRAGSRKKCSDTDRPHG